MKFFSVAIFLAIVVESSGNVNCQRFDQLVRNAKVMLVIFSVSIIRVPVFRQL